MITNNIKKIAERVSENAYDELSKTLNLEEKIVNADIKFKTMLTDHNLELMIKYDLKNILDLESLDLNKKYSASKIFLVYFNILNDLEKVIARPIDKLKFIEWYVKSYMEFYTNISFNEYLEIYKTMLVSIKLIHHELVNNLTLFDLIATENEAKIIVKNSQADLQKNFASLKVLTETSNIYLKMNIGYLEQYDILKYLGLDIDYLNALKQELIITNNLKVEETIEPVISKISENKKEDIKPKPAKKVLLAELRKYLSLDTLLNSKILTDEQLEYVFSLLQDIYPGKNITNLYNKIINHNETLKVKVYNDTLNKLLNREDQELLKNLTEMFHKENKALYEAMFGKIYNDINELIQEYIIDNDESLLEIYQEQIALDFKEIRTLLPYVEERKCLII